jgi:branched-chain amino acid aminotransferase
MSGRLIWHNGEMRPESEAKLSIFDSALLWGDMVFEMTRSFNQRPFKLKEHLLRLLQSANMARIEIPYALEDLEKAHDVLLETNRPVFDPNDEFRTMINVSRGAIPIYKRLVSPGINVMMATLPLRWVLDGTSWWYDSGVSGFIPVQRAIPAQLMDPKLKHRSRLYLKLAQLEAHNAWEWPLLLDPDGFVAESTGANVFVVKAGRVFTPEPRNCLRGISRQYVLDLLARSSQPGIEKNLEVYDLATADELFFTCTPYSIVPCTRFEGRPIGTGRPGAVTRRLMEHWAQNVGCDFVAQARAWDAAARA